MNKYTLYENNRIKTISSKKFNSFFNKKTGFTATWGENQQDDPDFSPVGPLIADIEISTICSKNCSFCYKNNTSVGENMSLKTFKKMFAKLPSKVLQQIAFGIGATDAHPELIDIIKYTKNKGVIPNLTINGDEGLTNKIATKLVQLCGAISVSHYDDDSCFNAVKKLTDLGLKQCNIHSFVSEDTYSKCMQLLHQFKSDERLSKLNAIVFLSLKQKGRGIGLEKLPNDKFKALIDYALSNNIPIGADSCSANKFMESIKDHKEYSNMKIFIEPCESFGLFSSYINVKGEYFPCSFAEGQQDWKEGISVLKCKDFLKDIWFSEKTNKYREASIKSTDCNGCRQCLIYDI